MKSTSSGHLLRAHAARALTAIVKDNRTIDWVTLNRPQWISDPLGQEIVYGTLRHHFSLHAEIQSFLEKPIRNKDQDVLELMLVGAYQLRYTSVPDHAAINESVAALVALQKPWAKGLMNAILRKIARAVKDNPENERRSLQTGPQTGPTIPEQSFDHPDWLVVALTDQYPDIAVELLHANNTRAPMTLRINTRKTSREQYIAELNEVGIAATQGAPKSAVVLDKPQTSASLPGWSSGAVAVQDMGAQFAAELLCDTGTQVTRILDACAAPGGKLSHLFESMIPVDSALNVELIALDANASRIEQTHEILTRLGHSIKLIQGDASQKKWWDGQPFSHILMDAPCSGTGTLRRHPDIKLLIKEASISEQTSLQQEILDNLWQMLAPGGILLYCTCSLLAEENDQIIDHFLAKESTDGKVLAINLPTGIATEFGWQLLPTDPNTDGFYYALLQKP